MKVLVDGYWIDKTPVTNLEYSGFVQEMSWKPPIHWNGVTPAPNIAYHPVTHVTFQDATAYATWAGKRLPSELEWEKAARGVDGRIYPWGDDWKDDRCNINLALVWPKGTSVVGRFSPQGDSPYGCVDMAGNVLEWTNSVLSADKEILRGGSGRTNKDTARCDWRGSVKKFSYSAFTGFRTVLSLG
jgi:formylglycine-generating enzyme required for sulfatase activity